MTSKNTDLDVPLQLRKRREAPNVADLTSCNDAPGSSPARAPSDKVVRMGVVGGNFGSTFQWHLDPNCRVTAVCDLRDDRLERLVKAYGPAATYKDFRQFLKHPELDAIAIFTPVPLHVWMATEAMKAGKHVISAVPAGYSVEELELLLETVKSTGLKYMMAETSYYYPSIITCREWARQGRFGTIFYSEAEYHHEGLIPLMYDERGFPTWRYGFPPLHYATHSTGMVIPVTGERLAEVSACGWGDNHVTLATNEYQNPFWNGTAFFKTSAGHSSRVSVFWHVANKECVRASFYGSVLSYVMARPEGAPNSIAQISQHGETAIESNGYPEGSVKIQDYAEPSHLGQLPEPMRVSSGHEGSQAFITHEFISAIVEDRWPAVNVFEAVAYTLPGIIAHQSALHDGALMKIRDYGKAPV